MSDEHARIDAATCAATTAASTLVDVVMAAGALPPAAAIAILETVGTLIAALQEQGGPALTLLRPTQQALGEVRQLLIADVDGERDRRPGSRSLARVLDHIAAKYQ
ncbi:hypothetical protein ACFXPX_36630 [Kitasatospora sp. NPDC059146]|uniref:hypothetical protein n=1 Tax=unclassified Kitasatospora TaxID=2633591 RepID=UPI0036B420B2